MYISCWPPLLIEIYDLIFVCSVNLCFTNIDESTKGTFNSVDNIRGFTVQIFPHFGIWNLFPVRLLGKEVFVIKMSKVLQFLAEHLEIEHIGSESANIYVRETWHCFNTLKELLFLYQNWESVDCTYDIFLISLRTIRGTPSELLESVSLIDSEEWRLIVLGDASASMVVLCVVALMKEVVPNDKYPRGHIWFEFCHE